MPRKMLHLRVDDVLKKLLAGELTLDKARRKLSAINVRYVGELARLDIGRAYRVGVPEMILGEGKHPSEVAKLAIKLARENGYALVTRADKRCTEEIKKKLPRGFVSRYNEKARAILVKRRNHVFPKAGRIGVLAAGTADIAVAEEASVAAEVMGCQVMKAYDVGIAGIHRLFKPLEHMLRKGVAALVVVAGMEGALPSVVASLVDVPVIGVPTSVGYGVGTKGVAALMTMLQTCSPKVVVVNIDNGLGAGIFAGMIARSKAS
jgi:NCAIR mutase (PurE)-related protein